MSGELPFSSNPSSASYVSALDLFNVGLWESFDPYDWDFNSGTRQYQAVLSCAMNSRHYQNEELCPICAETIVSKLMSAQSQTFDRSAFQNAPGAWLELYGRNPSSCGNGDTDKDLNLEGLVQINGTVLGAAAFEKPERNGKQIGASGSVVRVNLTPYVTRNSTATVTFRTRASSDPDRRLFLPGIQIVNGQGARYSVQPQSASLASALAAKAYGQDCAFFYWDLSSGAEGQLSLTFVPH